MKMLCFVCACVLAVACWCKLRDVWSAVRRWVADDADQNPNLSFHHTESLAFFDCFSEVITALRGRTNFLLFFFLFSCILLIWKRGSARVALPLITTCNQIVSQFLNYGSGLLRLNGLLVGWDDNSCERETKCHFAAAECRFSGRLPWVVFIQCTPTLPNLARMTRSVPER